MLPCAVPNDNNNVHKNYNNNDDNNHNNNVQKYKNRQDKIKQNNEIQHNKIYHFIT